MGKTTAHTPKLSKKFNPFVSVCTPTFNRRPFIEMMFQCFRNQTYPKDRMEWIIVDDGTDKIEDMVKLADIPQIKYFKQDKKMPLGEKRNFMHKQAKGGIIVYMDDDDYYPPERVEHAVERLMENRDALCAGSSEIYIYFKHIQTMYQCGPYGPNHATAGTFAFRTELLKQTQYEDHAALAEEKAFLKNYTIPFVQLDPLKSILVFSHIHNTFDKRKLLDSGQHPDFFKPSTKTVDHFIRQPKEAPIKQFFMTDIDNLLEKYEPGNPKMKPDVLKQMKEMEIERAKMAQQQQNPFPNQNNPVGQITMNQEGKPPVVLSNEQIVQIITEQQTKIKEYELELTQLRANQQNNTVGQIMMNQEGKPSIPLTKEQIIQIMTDQQTKIHTQDEIIKTLQLKLEMKDAESAELDKSDKSAKTV
jgi:hypothetical protein